MPKKKITKKPVIEVKDLYKSFKVGKGTVDVLRGINFEIMPGEFVVIFGPSGCGKSTLLNTMVGLEVPTKGKVYVRGTDVYSLDTNDRSEFRRKKFGIVQQQSNWIKSLNVIENVALPLCISGQSYGSSIKRAHKLLNLFRLEEFEKNTPTELSGGQQQRVSVVRALVSNPWIVITDEPTGNLDTTSAADLMYVLQYLNSESKRTVIMVTHNPEYEKYATKVIKMEDGKVKSVVTKKEIAVSDDDVAGDVVPPDAAEVPA
ncbi:MAG: ABC transporter ATP-binding protein [Patescibacteria group bacterium]|nr:ABC transporter ATP-binding protein [Patescibacteria group bacterium]